MQELYARVANHMLMQFERCIGEDGFPAYRNGSLKGPVGFVLKDDAYSPLLEGECSIEEPVVEALRRSGIRGKDSLRMMLGFQLIHDEVPVEQWRAKIRKLGQMFELNPIGA